MTAPTLFDPTQEPLPVPEPARLTFTLTGQELALAARALRIVSRRLESEERLIRSTIRAATRRSLSGAIVAPMLEEADRKLDESARRAVLAETFLEAALPGPGRKVVQRAALDLEESSWTRLLDSLVGLQAANDEVELGDAFNRGARDLRVNLLEQAPDGRIGLCVRS